MAVIRNPNKAEIGVLSDGGVGVTMRMVRTGGFPIRRCNRVDVHIRSRRQQQALRDLMDGMEADGNRCRSTGEVVRALLDRFADAQEAGGPGGR